MVILMRRLSMILNKILVMKWMKMMVANMGMVILMKRVWMLMNNLKIRMILKEILGVQLVLPMVLHIMKEILGVQLVLPMVLHIMKFELEQELEVYYVQDIGGE